ncbi:hypothetical protein [Streptomyces sp. NPDC020742]|uniref:hypothetical protein n=1 Tax=Streptomyces sp. NPDC020742 TaxID=3154897 RepID=UPI0033FDC503
MLQEFKDVETVTAELREALARAGVVLPSLRPDPVTVAHGYLSPLVDLGRCSMDVARQLTDALGEPARGERP